MITRLTYYRIWEFITKIICYIWVPDEGSICVITCCIPIWHFSVECVCCLHLRTQEQKYEMVWNKLHWKGSKVGKELWLPPPELYTFKLYGEREYTSPTVPKLVRYSSNFCPNSCEIFSIATTEMTTSVRSSPHFVMWLPVVPHSQEGAALSSVSLCLAG